MALEKVEEKGVREADIHFELYRHVQNVIEKGGRYDSVQFTRCVPEYGEGIKGFADLVIFDSENKPWLVIEAKRRLTKGYTREIDPYAAAVIRQAHDYAAQLGSPFFATYNGQYFVLFRTFEEFKPLAQRVSKSYRAPDLVNLATFSSRFLQDLINLHYGTARWDFLDESSVARLRSFHSVLEPFFLRQIHKQRKDRSFATRLRKWLENQGKNVADMSEKELESVLLNFARQAAYLFMNKVLFYKILEVHGKYRVPKLILPKKNVVLALREQYEKVARDINFEAVFDYDPIYDEIVPGEIEQPLREFAEELDSYNLAQFNSDIIGKVYEGLIPPKERHDLGQYYTPAPIVELICRLCITGADCVVLDPACGSGGFCIGAYNRLLSLKRSSGKKGSIHNEILQHIHAIDINKFPAHLTAINLSVRDLEEHTNIANVEVLDFFDFEGRQGRFAFEHLTLAGSRITKVFPVEYDAIVANPPYIRRHDMASVEKPRKHLSNLGVKAFSGWADIYCYFITHALEFLKSGGKLGFIVSDRWFYTDYGKDLQAFLLERCKISFIVWFEKQQFEIPLISTVILVIERCDHGRERDDNHVRFLRIKEVAEVGEVESILARPVGSEGEKWESDRFRFVAIKQKELYAVPGWNIIIQAPDIYFEVLASGKFVPFKELANISIPEQTGANEFFYIKTEDAANVGLEPRFLSPLIKSVGQAEYILFREGDTDLRVLDVHSYVERIEREEGLAWVRKRKGQKVTAVKRRLEQDGHSGLLQYLKQGEEQDVDQKDTCQRREIWFDLGDIPTSPLMFPAEYWRRSFVFTNPDGVKMDKHLFYVRPRPSIDVELIAAVTNSVFMPIMREIHGRVATAQAINRNEVWVGQAQDLFIPDIRQFSDSQIAEVKTAFRALMENERSVAKGELEVLYRNLDEAVCRAVGFGDRLHELCAARDRFIEIREKGKGLDKQVLVQHGG